MTSGVLHVGDEESQAGPKGADCGGLVGLGKKSTRRER